MDTNARSLEMQSTAFALRLDQWVFGRLQHTGEVHSVRAAAISIVRCYPASRVDQTTTLGFWNRIAKLLRSINPETNSFLCAGERRLLAGTVCGAPGEL